MNILESLRDTFRHMDWADATVWRAVLGSASASADTVIKDRLHHTHLVQRAFLNVWRKLPHTRNAGSELSLMELAPWGREYHALASDYLSTLSEADLDQPMAVPWARLVIPNLGHEPAIPSLGETMLQVAAHSTYHRGQVNARLRELGNEPALTDFIVWIWFGKPAPEWIIASE